MTLDLSHFKKNRVDLKTLIEETEKLETKSDKREEDTRFWTPGVDKAGNGYAVIRFLPAPDQVRPWTLWWDHGFQGPTGKWYIEKSLTSLQQQDPLGELNSRLWKTEDPKLQDLVRKRKRRLHHVANIMVISDPANPENEGKVFLYRFGVKIMEKIKAATQPEFPDETPIQPFDLWEGADFVIKIRKVSGYRNYDLSAFKSPSELLSGDEEKLQKVVSELYPLAEFLDQSNFKTWDELESRLREVLGFSGDVRSVPLASVLNPDETQEVSTTPAAPKQIPTAESSMEKEEIESVSEKSSDEDDTLSYFQSMADEMLEDNVNQL